MIVSPARLLLIDDDLMLRTLVSRQLDDAGYEVHVAEDGSSGFELTRALRPDLVLCDWVMPDVDGLDYCRRIKSEPELRGTYVALLSARCESSDRITGLDAGADDFLSKPIEPDELLARVRAGLRRQDVLRELADVGHRAALLELATTLGHEINNPLTALFGHMELVLQYLEKDDPQRMQYHIRQAGAVSTRIAEVAQRLITLTDPQTKPYLNGLRMLDLDRSR